MIRTFTGEPSSATSFWDVLPILGLFGSIESAFGPWLSRLFETLSSTFAGPEHTADTLGPTRPQPRVIMTTLDQPDLLSNQFEGLKLKGSRERIPVTLTRNERMTRADWFQDVHRVEFKADDDISYVK